MAVIVAGPAAAEEPALTPQNLEGLQQELDESRKRERALRKETQGIKADIARLKRDAVSAAKATQEREATVTALEERLAKLDAEAVVKRAQLARQRNSLSSTLAVLQRLAIYPEAMMIAAPGDPNDTLRTSLLLATVVPQLQRGTSSLRAELDTLAALSDQITAERSALRTAALELERDQTRLERLVREKKTLAARTEKERRQVRRRMARLGKEARSLKDLIRKLEREDMLKPVSRPASKLPPHARMEPPGTTITVLTRGKMHRPARGRITTRFGQRSEIGRSRHGMVIRTRPGAQVVAPFDGKVVFAGPFRGYGQILIIEHGGGYHTLLAGFSRIDSVPAQRLLAGEPVGVVGRPEGGEPFLYVELRDKGRPINPLPWLAASN